MALQEARVGVPEVAVSLSPGILSIRHLSALLGLEQVLTPRQARKRGLPADVVLVWGRKRGNDLALQYADRRGLPVWYLEDGWIRTSSSRPHSRKIYSLLLDRVGIYYDSSKESELELFLNQNDSDFAKSCSGDDLEYARITRQKLIQEEITKYNYCSSKVADYAKQGKAFVLVVDQTVDDISVQLGGMNAHRFAQMLECAIDENPDSNLVVRTHPDVVAGRRKGYLTKLAKRYGIKIVPGSDNPIACIKRAQRVYTGTSQMGYEALLCERPVSVFGLPFYAGWGLSDDRQTLPRRVRQRTIEQMFHATHVYLARYCSPMSGRRWQLHQTLEHVALQKSYFRLNAKRFHCVGITPWKRGYVSQFLRSPDGSISFGGEDNVGTANALVTWGFRRFLDGLGSPDQRLGKTTWRNPSKSDSAALPVLRMEDGFLRSAGLGSNYTAPGSLVLDGQGLYFDPESASDLESLLNKYECSDEELGEARRLRQMILDTGVSKYDVSTGYQRINRSADKKVVLVAGQVEDDESLKRGCSEITSNALLLQAVRKARPEAWIVYRPHPDVLAGNRRGEVDPFTEQCCADQVDTSSTIIDCINDCDEVHTMTSLSGFEALLREKQVVTYGSPFYAGWGLTTDTRSFQRRRRCRTLDELVYLVLIKYPRYLDVDSGEFITAEQMIRAIRRQKERAVRSDIDSWTGRQVLKLANIVRGLRYAP